MRKNTSPAEDPDGLVCQCRLPLSSTILDLVSSLVRGHLKKIRSRWRKFPPGRIALIILAVLRHDQRLSDMAGGTPSTRSLSPAAGRPVAIRSLLPRRKRTGWSAAS
ncbi:hypothetical protein OOK36_56990 [Streptomyces sp. NBC_00365]|uniref:hypothetical protein n=1 Tax=Streptomyces sp. NBC_00365 TaxID=2975726 RepID=UPI00225459FE|nr:hypothetical protein [Streptomyces sp. NBC_00365]MCX5097929.1 hypothetical protein [Streptomyces sp. NBC_00365]